MKILFITHYADTLGANRSLLHLLEGLRGASYNVEVQVWCPRSGRFTEELARRGIEYRILPFPNAYYTFRSLGLYLFPYKWWLIHQNFPKWTAELAEWQPDVIHSNSAVVILGAIIAEKLNIPHVWHTREFVWEHYKMVSPIKKDFLHRLRQQAAAHVAISDCVKQRAFTDLDSQKNTIFTVYNGIGTAKKIAENYNDITTATAEKSTTQKSTTQKSTTQKSTFTFLNIGLLHPAKKQMEALRALRIVRKNIPLSQPNVRLLIVGKGRKGYEMRMKLYVWWHNLSKSVDFLGFMASPNVAYQRADAVLMCSENEAMGRVTVEAMAQGKPVIGKISGATPEIIQDGVNGLLYAKNEIDLAKKMLILINNDINTNKKMIENAYETVINNFTDETYISKMYAIFKNVIK